MKRAGPFRPVHLARYPRAHREPRASSRHSATAAGTHRPAFTWLARAALVLAAALATAPSRATSQEASPRADSLARVTLTVRHDDAPCRASSCEAFRPTPARATRHGAASPPEPTRAALRRSPFQPARTRSSPRVRSSRRHVHLILLAAQDTAVAIELVEEEAELETIVVTATRGERRVEDTPLRVEVIDEEEIAEKVAMTPGDIAMMLNETSGLRVQSSNPSLGGASVRIQGLRGRYSLLLADGLPL